MIDKIIKIIEKIILPKYPEIDDVKVDIKYIDGDLYVVEYSLKEELSNVRAIDLIGDTRSLLRMMSIENGMVDFKLKSD